MKATLYQLAVRRRPRVVIEHSSTAARLQARVFVDDGKRLNQSNRPPISVVLPPRPAPEDQKFRTSRCSRVTSAKASLDSKAYLAAKW